MQNTKVTIVGAGLAGSLLAIYLAKRGLRSEIFERRPDMRKTNISAGRSINLALSVRGFHALAEVGLKEAIMKVAIPMKGRMLHATDGEISFVPYGRNDSEVIYSVSRGVLNRTLLDAAEKQHGVPIYFNQTCTALDCDDGLLEVRDENSSAVFSVECQQVIGADGAASAVRAAIMETGGFDCSRDELEHGYKELTIPPGERGGFRLEKHALHIWPRGNYMLIALPNQDSSFTCTLFFPLRGETSFAALKTPEQVRVFFDTQFPDAVPLMPTLTDDFFNNPTGRLATVKCEHWAYKDKACLLGDAAHAIVPFFGQGINCGFEDCTTFNACLEEFGTDWHLVFAELEQRRKANTDAIAELSLANYHEMRDRVAGPKFALMKQVEFALEEAYPDRFIPKYSMVSFHRIPYSVALARGAVQQTMLDQLCAHISSVDQLDWQQAEALVQQLSPL